MVEDEIMFTAALVESLVKMPYPAPERTPPFSLQAVFQNMQHRKEESERLQALPEGEPVKFLVERDYRHGLNLLRAALAWDLPGYDDAMTYLDDVHARPERYSSYLCAAKKIDPELVPEWAVLEAYLFHRYAPEVGMAHSLRLATLTEFLDANRDRLMQEGLGVQSSSGDIRWNRELIEILCTIPVTVSETQKPVLTLKGSSKHSLDDEAADSPPIASTSSTYTPEPWNFVALSVARSGGSIIHLMRRAPSYAHLY